MTDAPNIDRGWVEAELASEERYEAVEQSASYVALLRSWLAKDAELQHEKSKLIGFAAEGLEPGQECRLISAERLAKLERVAKAAREALPLLNTLGEATTIPESAWCMVRNNTRTALRALNPDESGVTPRQGRVLGEEAGE